MLGETEPPGLLPLTVKLSCCAIYYHFWVIPWGWSLERMRCRSGACGDSLGPWDCCALSVTRLAQAWLFVAACTGSECLGISSTSRDMLLLGAVLQAALSARCPALLCKAGKGRSGRACLALPPPPIVGGCRALPGSPVACQPSGQLCFPLPSNRGIDFWQLKCRISLHVTWNKSLPLQTVLPSQCCL